MAGSAVGLFERNFNANEFQHVIQVVNACSTSKNRIAFPGRYEKNETPQSHTRKVAALRVLCFVPTQIPHTLSDLSPPSPPSSMLPLASRVMPAHSRPQLELGRWHPLPRPR